MNRLGHRAHATAEGSKRGGQQRVGRRQNKESMEQERRTALGPRKAPGQRFTDTSPERAAIMTYMQTQEPKKALGGVGGYHALTGRHSKVDVANRHVLPNDQSWRGRQHSTLTRMHQKASHAPVKQRAKTHHSL